MDLIHQNYDKYVSMPDKTHLSERCAIQIANTKLSDRVREQIISYFKTEHYKNEKKNPHNSSYDFWSPLSLRALDPHSVHVQYKQRRISMVEYLFRHKEGTKWFWRETELTETVKNIVEPFSSVFKFFTRVKIHVQQPNFRVGFHRDLTAGQTYNIVHPLSTEYSRTQRHVYQMYPWVQLQDLPQYPADGPVQNFYSLKIPISEDPVFYGRQTIVDEKPYYYRTDGNAYFLNENRYHGSEGVPYLRGLIFVDGIIDPAKFAALNLQKVPCEAYDFPELKGPSQ